MAKSKNQIIDKAVKNVLELKFKLGLFDDPYKYSDIERGKKEIVGNAQHHGFSWRKLLKNQLYFLKK